MTFDAEYGLDEDGKVRILFHKAGYLYPIAKGQRILLPTMNKESTLLALQQLQHCCRRTEPTDDDLARRP